MQDAIHHGNVSFLRLWWGGEKKKLSDHFHNKICNNLKIFKMNNIF